MGKNGINRATGERDHQIPAGIKGERACGHQREPGVVLSCRGSILSLLLAEHVAHLGAAPRNLLINN